LLLVYGDGATQCTIYTQQLQPGLLVGTLGVSCTCSDGHVGHMANAGQCLGEGCNRLSAAWSCLEYWEYPHCKGNETTTRWLSLYFWAMLEWDYTLC